MASQSNLAARVDALVDGASGAAWRGSPAMDVLGAILAEAAGPTLTRLLRRLVLDPLGLSDGGFEVADRARAGRAPSRRRARADPHGRAMRGPVPRRLNPIRAGRR